MNESSLKTNSEAEITQERENSDFDASPFFEWLRTNQGHEIAGRIVSIFDDLKKLAIERTHTNAKLEIFWKYGIVAIVIVSASLLAYFGKLDSTTALLFGTLVGYFFGKK